MYSNKLNILVLLLTILVGCEDVLDKRNLNAVDDLIWSDYESAELYINNLYAENMPDVGFADNGGFVDEYYSANFSTASIVYGNIANNPSLIEVTEFSKETYQYIRTINIAIKGLTEGNLVSSEKGELLGQAYFFRAWRYWQMVKLYGGVPMILTAQDPFTEELNVARSSAKECVNIIVSDLDKAIAGLPGRWERVSDDGRITSVAAAAFKSRVLLHFASPLFNPDNIAERWSDAYEAAVEAKELADNNAYGLNNSFNEIFTDDPTSNPEAILYRAYDGTSSFSNNWESLIRPSTGGGAGAYSPTLNLVKAFPMSNGKAITDPNSGYDANNFWFNRDPRFYATIAYNGSNWKMTGRELGDIVWTYFLNSWEESFPSSGFYCRKASNPSLSVENTGNGTTAWLEIRYAEILLNLAESANEINKPEEALENLGLLRERAGILSDENYGLGLDFTQSDLREKIITERQIELAFENRRYWDVRRLRLYTQDLGDNIKKLNGTRRKGLFIMVNPLYQLLIQDPSSDYFKRMAIDTAIINGSVNVEEPNIGLKYFITSEKDLDSFDSYGKPAYVNYQDYYYFFPIQESLITKSPAIKQTIGWGEGTFDPLAE